MNQLNIVIGISVAFFSNYLILQIGGSGSDWSQQLGIDQWSWRWMLGIEALPAALYLLGLLFVPESPRWLISQGQEQKAKEILCMVYSETSAQSAISEVKASLSSRDAQQADSVWNKIKSLSHRRLRLVMLVGISIAILQQITGINAVFFYAPMIFEQSGIGTDAAFMQAIAVGLTNLVFTLVAIFLIDKIGRKKLLMIGVSGIAMAMLSLAQGFSAAHYQLTPSKMTQLPENIDRDRIAPIVDTRFEDDLAYKHALRQTLGNAQFVQHEAQLIKAAIHMNPTHILLSIVVFVACFAFSLGPVMWVLFSELFPNYIRAFAISFVGLINSGVSFAVQLLFPWQLANLGTSHTFLMYGIFAMLGLVIIVKTLPETKGRSLEELEHALRS